jgi:glycosyltransferase involved in cell wall biosynthesis
MRKENSACKITFKNVNNMLSLEAADDMICPTRWQAESFPSEYRSKITIVHDGIDTDKLAPNSKSTITLRSGLTLTSNSEIVTFLSRNLEPYRGYHILMRALPRLLEQRPNLRVIIVGGDGVSYGSEPETKNGVKQSWKNLVIDEVKESIKPEDWSRIHFVGKIPYDTYTRLIQISSVHIYLTYPFVLSWSLLEAMSMGVAIVASDTKPVLEYIKDGENGLLFDFFDVDALADLTIKLLADPSERSRLGMNARKSVVSKLDLKTICLPHQIDWVENI